MFPPSRIHLHRYLDVGFVSLGVLKHEACQNEGSKGKSNSLNLQELNHGFNVEMPIEAFLPPLC
jgi:hypothetical protein